MFSPLMKEGYIYIYNNNNFVTMHALIQYSVVLEILNITFQKKNIKYQYIFFLNILNSSFFGSW